MMIKVRVQVLMVFILTTFGMLFSAHAQSGEAEVRGFVYDKATGEPMIFTNVILKGTRFAAKTDVNGFYAITKIPPGKYMLFSTNVGYDTTFVSIELKAGTKLNQRLEIDASSVDLDVVDINAEKTEALTDVKISTTKISPKQIAKIPSIGGQPDLAQYLQVLPGVIFTGDQGGQLYIRGGAPIQNKVLLDGMVLYNPFHTIGLFSVFDVDILRNVDVYTGGFNAEYGGRISAVMDITTRDGNKKNFAGKISSSPFLTRLLVEGPLTQYDPEKTSVSYIVSGKKSYLEQSAKLLYAYADEDGLPYNFTDLYAKMSINAPNGSKFNAFGFSFNDDVNYFNPAALSWKATGGGANFVVIPGTSSALIGGNFAVSNYETQLVETASKPRQSAVNGFNGGLNFTYFYGDNEFKYGLELLGFRTDFSFTNAANIKIQQETFTTEIAGYLKYKYVSGLLVIEPSLRGHYYASLSEMSPEPRLGLKYIVSENIRFKAASGFYSQNLLSATSDKDIVNLFNGFLSAPESLPKFVNGKERNSNLQKAKHLIAGFEFDVNNRLTLNIEGYLKKFDQLININRDQLYPDTKENISVSDELKKDFIIEEGLAKGIDFVAKYETKKFYLWFVYSLGKVTREYNGRKYSPHFDRRHNINIVSTYELPKGIEFDLRWNFGSGFPFTQTQGFFQELDFQEGQIAYDYVNANGSFGVIYGGLNQGRLPYYHRLDLAVKKKWELAKRNTIELSVGATNVYNRENIFYFDRIRYDRKNQLPILPTIGFSFTF